MTPLGAGAADHRPAPGRERPAVGDDPLLTIGELLAHLAADFPEVSHSKVRFLEDRGLVSPRRTPSGYRQFAPADVDRLRAVLTLQRDHYLPLRVIREHLDALDGGLAPPPLPGTAGTAASSAQAPSTGDRTAPGTEPGDAFPPQRRPAVQRAAVLAAAGGSLALVEALEDHGLLPHESAGRYPAGAVELVAAARTLGDHGIEPRHLRALRSAVGHEAALVEQVVSPLRRRPPAEAVGGTRAEQVGDELVATLLALHAAALGCALHDALPSP